MTTDRAAMSGFRTGYKMSVSSSGSHRSASVDADADGTRNLHPDVARVMAEVAARRWGTCLHECGHVLTALVLKMRVYSVQLVTGRGGDTGHGGYFNMVPHDPSEPEPKPSTEHFSPEDSFVINMIAIMFGGLAAEMCAPIGTTDFVAGARDDFRRINSLLDRIDGTAEQKQAIRKRANDLAHDAVHQYWHIVEALARQLEDKRILFRDEILEVVRRAGGYALLGEDPPAKMIRTRPAPEINKVFDPHSSVMIGATRNLDGRFIAIGRSGCELGAFDTRAVAAVHRATARSGMRWRADGVMSTWSEVNRLEREEEICGDRVDELWREFYPNARSQNAIQQSLR
jgi:hypothetical protein